MSDISGSSPRPVSLLAVISILGCFALFLLVAYYGYASARSPAPQAIAPEKFPEDQAWKSTHTSKQAALAELRAQQQKRADSYAWVDQKTGTIQLPVTRAMELVVRENGASK